VPERNRHLKWDRLSLRNKLTIVTTTLLTLGLTVAGIGTMLLLRPTLISQLDGDLRAIAADPDVLLHSDPVTGQLSFDEVSDAPRPYYVAAVSPDGEVIVDNSAQVGELIVPDIRPITNEFESGFSGATGPTQPTASQGEIITLRDPIGTAWRGILVPNSPQLVDGPPSALIVAVPLESVNATMAAFIAIFVGFGLSVVIFGAAATRLLVTMSLQPLRRVEATAMDFAAGDHSARLAPGAPNTEVGRLSRALNTMLARIDTAIEERDDTIEQMRRFVGDASHELRTPLVTVRGYGELYRMGALDDDEKVAVAMNRIESEAIRMTGLVEDLLQLARLEEAKTEPKELLDLEIIVGEAAMDAHASSPDRPVQVLPTRVVLDESDIAADGTMHAGSHSLAVDHPAVLVDGKRMELSQELQDARAEHDRQAAAFDEMLVSTGMVPIISPAEGDAGSAPDSGDEAEMTTDASGRRFLRWRPKPRDGSPSRGRTLQMHMRRRKPASSAAASAQEASFRNEISPETYDLPAIILGNANRVQQAIQNVIGNALRYTPDGSPLELGVVLDPGARLATVEIRDHGEGIPEEIRARIFQRFWRADTSRARHTGGSGLGLAIVAAIMQSHGGTAEVVETKGGGATFLLNFPLLLAAPVDDDESTDSAAESAADSPAS